MLTESKQTTTIQLPAELSRNNVEAFQARLDSALRDGPAEIVLDCAPLVHVTSKDIALLWQAHEQCSASGAAIRLVSMSQYLIRILKTLDLYEYFRRDDDQVRAKLTAAVQPDDNAGTATYINLFVASDEGVEAALTAFLEFLERHRPPQLVILELRTIFYEVATNIRTHSGLGEESPVAFSASILGASISLKFADTGLFFDPTNSNGQVNMREAAHARKTRGFGITMYHRLADTVRYERIEGLINLLTLSKTWSD